MQYAHNLSFKETKTFFFIIFIIIRAMILKMLGEGNSNSADFNYSQLDSGADTLTVLGQVINTEKLPL